ncbi:MAG: hypothetical protein WC900_01050 [Oscillospiraceae bacterium]|jgi:hypothetical protein
MSKKIYHIAKGKIYKPKNVIPTGYTNIITDNITTENGCVFNCSEMNAGYARRWVDENHL